MSKKLIFLISLIFSVMLFYSNTYASKDIGGLGHIIPSGGIINLTAPHGDAVAEVLIKEGDLVKKGAPLIVFKSKMMRETEVALSKLNLKDSEEIGSLLIKLQQLKVKETDESGLRGIQSQKLKIKDLEESGKKALEIQKLKLKSAQMDYDYSKAGLTRLVKAGSETYSTQQKELRENNSNLANNNLDIAKQELEKLQQDQVNSLQIARGELKRLEIDHEIKLNIAKEELNKLIINHEITVQRSKEQLNKAVIELEKSTLTSPIDGTILKIDLNPGNTNESLIVQIANLNRLEVIAEIFQDDIVRITTGMKITVSNNCLPKSINGTIIFVGRIISEKTKNAEVRILLDESEQASKLLNLEVNVSVKSSSN